MNETHDDGTVRDDTSILAPQFQGQRGPDRQGMVSLSKER